MSFQDTLNKIVDRYKILEKELAQGVDVPNFIQLSKECSHLNTIAHLINKYHDLQKNLENLEKLMSLQEEDPEVRKIAKEEYFALKDNIPVLEHELKIALLPKDSNDDKNAILEVRAGTGGEEAALFAHTLLTIYQKYAAKQNWKFEILSLSETGIGGIKEGIALISGPMVFARLKHESGTHRVQRIPKTEVKGRIHTSAATVAVLPEMEEIDITVDEKDLQIDTYRASGAGGQHVNTTDSAVRITHLPTGIVVTQQDERSQHKNKARAMKILLAKIHDAEVLKRNSDVSSQRKAQVGSGDRSERIRTYNFPQDRITDHRIGLTLYKLNDIVEFGSLDEIIDALMSHYEAERLAAVND